MLSAASGADEKDDQYIVEHYHEAITLKEIAESASISIEECRRCFKDIIKETPMHYLSCIVLW